MALAILLFKIGQNFNYSDFLFFFKFLPKDSDPGEHSFWKLITLPKVALIAFVINSLSSCFGFLDPTLSLFVLEKVGSLIVKELSTVEGGYNCLLLGPSWWKELLSG